jgi:hypothetical protein
MGTDVDLSVEVHRALEQPSSDELGRKVRGGRYGEIFVEALSPKGYALANEGSYNVVSNPTPGTGLATIATLTTLVDTSPFLLIQNPWGSDDTQAKRIFIDYIKLQVTAPGTGGTQLRYATKIDQARADRYTSGGTQLTAQNVNMGTAQASKANIYAGALVGAAAAQSRLLSSGLVRPVIPVIADTYIFDFCSTAPSLGGLITSGTAIANCIFPVAPAIIGPQQWFAFHIWLPSQSAASSYEIEVGYWER